MAKKIVVIGGVAAGPKAAARARRLDPSAEITIVEKDEILSYAGCGLPYYISGMVQDRRQLMATPIGVLRDPKFFAKVKNINVLNRTEAIEHRPAGQGGRGPQRGDRRDTAAALRQAGHRHRRGTRRAAHPREGPRGRAAAQARRGRRPLPRAPARERLSQRGHRRRRADRHGDDRSGHRVWRGRDRRRDAAPRAAHARRGHGAAGRKAHEPARRPRCHLDPRGAL